MRALLWILLLLCLFAVVSLYHSRFTQSAREDRDAAHAASSPDEPLPSGFNGRVVVGEKSGAPLVEGVPIQRPQAPGKTPPKNAPPAAPTTATQHVVKAGESLSVICARYYGTSRPDLVNALAKFNQLKDANAVRVGQTLQIPPLATLGVAAK